MSRRPSGSLAFWRWFALLALCWALNLPANAATSEGRVVAVTDGDTVVVLDSHRRQHKVRLAGIDAPEKGQAFGGRSRQHLASLVHGKQVVLQGDKYDRYGRMVVKVLINDIDAGLAQVSAGFAWHYKKYAGEQSSVDQRLYQQAEQMARSARRGLWADHAPVAPWAYRRSRRP